MDHWDTDRKIREYDCPRCDKHHSIPYQRMGTFVCECGVDPPPHYIDRYVSLGQYKVSFGSNYTLISWVETITKQLWDMIATIDNVEKIYGNGWGSNPIAVAYAHQNKVYKDCEVDEERFMKIPGYHYKITLEKIEKLMLLR